MTFYPSPSEGLPAGLGSNLPPHRAGRSKPRYAAERRIRPLPLPRAAEGRSGPHMSPQGPSRWDLLRASLPAGFGAPGIRGDT
jgi:hypothetical protein